MKMQSYQATLHFSNGQTDILHINAVSVEDARGEAITEYNMFYDKSVLSLVKVEVQQ